MISEITNSFREDYGKLSSEIKTHIKRTYKLWIKNPQHPSLRFKRIHSTESIWSVRVGLNYRVVGIKHDNKMLWFFVGAHAEYEALIKKL